jgi:thiosulfate dehydrogenase
MRPRQAPAAAPAAPQFGQGGVYERLTPREQMIADAETAKFIELGKEIFHDPDKLGGTIGVSCDMCHPDAASTHLETYPKFQTQLQRVALLRDMINCCIENPVKGKPLNPDDPRLRALKAYIIAQRNGTALAYGKH